MAQEGDILGLGGPINPNDDLTRREHDVTGLASEEAKRRRRMNEGADEVTPTASGTTPDRGQGGAAGIDMGSGGEGTGIE
ncbi:MAG TPA: hypothetical protein VFK57_08655 [Vicinamibacterales bacterium]|nr:hypothetical protein [Vicinamibacterales bacterium]